MIGKISNYNLAFKSAYFSHPHIRIQGKEKQDDYTTNIKNKDEIERINSLQEQIDTMTDNYGVNMVAKLYIDKYRTNYSRRNCKDITIEYTIYDKEHCKKGLRHVDWISCAEDDEKLLNKIENTICDTKTNC